MQGAKLKATKTPTLTEVALKVGDRYFALHGGSLYTLNCDSDGNVLNADYVATLPSFATNGVQWFVDRLSDKGVEVFDIICSQPIDYLGLRSDMQRLLEEVKNAKDEFVVIHDGLLPVAFAEAVRANANAAEFDVRYVPLPEVSRKYNNCEHYVSVSVMVDNQAWYSRLCTLCPNGVNLVL